MSRMYSEVAPSWRPTKRVLWHRLVAAGGASVLPLLPTRAARGEEGDAAQADGAQPPVGAGAVTPEHASGSEAPVTPGDTGAPPQISALELAMLALVNGARTSRGLAPLEWDQTMAEAARVHAADMMRRGVVSHRGSDGSSPTDRLRQAGVKFRFGSENIWTYWGKVPEQGPSTMHAAMMAEPHQAGLWNHIGNILYAGYKRIGIGIVTSPGGVQYLSQKFAD